MLTNRLATLAACAALLVSQPVLAEPPTDADIDRALATFKQVFAATGGATEQQVKDAAAAAMKDLDVREMTGLQLARLMDSYNLLSEAGQLDAAWARMETFLPDRGPDGAAAAARLLGRRLRSAPDEAARLQILRDTIAHPGLDEAARRGGLDMFLGILRAESGQNLPALRSEILGLERLLTPELAPRLSPFYIDYYEMVRASGPDDAATLERVRARLVTLARGALAAGVPENKEFIQNVAAYLDGRYIRGELVGHKAPTLDLLWCSDPSIKSLESLKGRVVVLDFWATWCGPCVASIPNVAELQERYKDSPVTIIGMTSPQGSIVMDGKIVATKGDEAREFELMREYITKKGITWPIAFSRQPVTNPDYGIRGIPHVVIIDPAGVVRHRAIHPAQPLKEKAEKIDALLREFGLPAPAPLAAAAPAGG